MNLSGVEEEDALFAQSRPKNTQYKEKGPTKFSEIDKQCVRNNSLCLTGKPAQRL